MVMVWTTYRCERCRKEYSEYVRARLCEVKCDAKASVARILDTPLPGSATRPTAEATTFPQEDGRSAEQALPENP